MSLFVYAATGAASRAVSPRHNGSERVNTYICLDELTALLSYSAHKAKHIHPLFHVHHVDHAVNDNERPSPPHPGTAQSKHKKAQGLLSSKQPGSALKQRVRRSIDILQKPSTAVEEKVSFYSQSGDNLMTPSRYAHCELWTLLHLRGPNATPHRFTGVFSTHGSFGSSELGLLHVGLGPLDSPSPQAPVAAVATTGHEFL